ncbi:MAG: nucleotidyltransferase [Actinobacteria bacterium]|nr:nucleotidyltransferase [Actinomycetota bacterium]
MRLDQTFKEFIEFLNARDVQYLIVGGYAVGAHGLPRATKDLDVWVLADPVNADHLMRALVDFGFGDVGLDASDFTREGVTVQLGYPPLRIDILTSIDGVSFGDAYPHRADEVVDGIVISFIGRHELIVNKRAAGRSQDIADAARLDGLE